jgi:hypothetical protein
MKRFTSTEIVVLLLAILFFLVGLWTVVHPKEMTIYHGSTARNKSLVQDEPYLEHVSEKEAVLFGCLSIALGTGLIVAVFFPRGK